MNKRTRTPSKEYIVVGSRSWSMLVCGAILIGIGAKDGAGGDDCGQPRVSLNWSRKKSNRGSSNDIVVQLSELGELGDLLTVIQKDVSEVLIYASEGP